MKTIDTIITKAKAIEAMLDIVKEAKENTTKVDIYEAQAYGVLTLAEMLLDKKDAEDLFYIYRTDIADEFDSIIVSRMADR